MSTINAPATLAEIAKVMGRNNKFIERWAKKENWSYTEHASHSRHKKRLYDLKHLPKAIQTALFNSRFTEESLHEKHRKAHSQPSGQAITHSTEVRAIERDADQRANQFGEHVNAVSDGFINESLCEPGRETAVVGRPEKRRMDQRKESVDVLYPVDLGRRDLNGTSPAQATGKTSPVTPAAQKRRQPAVLATDGTGLSDGAVVSRKHSALPCVKPSIETLSDEKQRLKDGARQMILDFVTHYPDSVEKACSALSAQYSDGSLAPHLVTALTDCNDKLNEARKGRLSPSTVRKWQALKRQTGHCIPAKTRTKTDWNTVWWLPLFLANYRKPQKPNVSEAYQDFVFDWREQGLPEADRPSYAIVNRLLNSMPKLIRETGRCTGSELAALKAFIRRDWSGPSNEVWVGDGHSFKAKVKHPETGKPFAPEVTVIIDAASRFIVGWAFSLSENQIAVSEALGKGMLKHGKPLIYYSDNGSGQTAKTIDCPAGGMLARLGVRHETGIPGNPQARGLIEGLWDITAIAVAKTFVTFQGTGMDSGALRKVTNAINSAKSKGEVPAFVPTWQEFMTACEERFDWYNHNHQHRSLKGKTPAAVYFANFDPTWACALTEHEIINLYRPFVLRMPARGEVKFLNNVYAHPDLVHVPDKTRVRVAFDLHDAKQVWISDLEGCFICVAGFESNSVSAFPWSKKDQLKQQRLQGIEKLAQGKVDHARAEMGYVIEGESEVLQAVPVIPREIEEPLMAPVLEPAFNTQKPVDDAPTQTYQELVLSLQKKSND